MKIIIVILFIAVLASLMSALYFLLNKKGSDDKRMFYSLLTRISLSLVIILFILGASFFGILKPKGIALPQQSATPVIFSLA